MKDELSGKIIKEFVGLRTRKCSYLTDENDESKKQNVQIISHKEKIKFGNYQNCLEATQFI